LSAALARRISRPTYPQLNPYINLIDRQTYEMGNMKLQPEKANKLDAGYSYTGKSLTVSGNAYVTYTTNFINQVAYLDNDILVTTYINADSDVKTGIDQNIRYSPARWLTLDLAGNTFYSASRGPSRAPTSEIKAGPTTATSALPSGLSAVRKSKCSTL
jgi:TonB dependent receptor.